MSSGRIAVVGGGWTGLAAAVTLAGAGRAVTVFEGAPALGGRARRVELRQAVVDNGQHILLGAYEQTLALLRTVHGARPEGDLLERCRLHLEEPGVFRLRVPPLPAPWHALTALLAMRGPTRRERLATVAFARRLRRSRFRCSAQLSVAAVLADQPQKVVNALWGPLCLSTLNTPPKRASAQIFLNLLRRAFAARALACDLLLPRVDLSALFPDAAARYVAARGGEIRLGRRVAGLAVLADGIGLTNNGAEEHFAAALVAVGPHQLSGLLGEVSTVNRAASLAAAQVARFAYEPIVTAYLAYPRPLTLAPPMLKLDGHPAQWVFDRGRLGGLPGLAAAVISADAAAASLEHAELVRAIDAQLRRTIPDLPPPAWSQVIAEQRATFACTPGLERPAAGAIAPRLYLAGDYTDTELPATLEAAARSGVAAARRMLAARY
jgi:squalene-associated FAD-dependent desaturase